MSGLSLQLPPPVTQSGFGFGLPNPNWADPGFSSAVALSYMKLVNPRYEVKTALPPSTLVKPELPPTVSPPTLVSTMVPEVFELMEKYNQLAYQETRLIQALREGDANTRKNLALQIQTVLHKKIQELTTFGQACAVTVVPDTGDYRDVLRLEEQPLGSVVANKYLDPIVVSVDERLLSLAREGRLQARASLCLGVTEETIGRTVDNKQEILQGHLVAIVGVDGKAIFNKLKIMDVSSKHSNQSFSIQLQLEEMKKSYSSAEEKIVSIGNPIKSSPLQVKSRMNKRKRSSSSSLSSSGNGFPKKRLRGEIDSSYVDITSLLILPQKEAATRLGISESMLCKRFKECTRRKWPYRYLRKIDKMIHVLTLNKKGDTLSKEEQDKVEKLRAEREECLHPVKIRITGHDVAQLNSNNISVSSGGSTPTDSDSYEEEGSEPEPEYVHASVSIPEPEHGLEDAEDAEIAQVVSTLNFLRQSRS